MLVGCFDVLESHSGTVISKSRREFKDIYLRSIKLVVW
jgi:hypothetical protein